MSGDGLWSWTREVLNLNLVAHLSVRYMFSCEKYNTHVYLNRSILASRGEVGTLLYQMLLTKLQITLLGCTCSVLH